MPGPGGAYPGGCLVWGCLLGGSGPGGAWSGEGGIPACTEADPPPPPPWIEFVTHATENITLPQTSFAGGNYVSAEC